MCEKIVNTEILQERTEEKVEIYEWIIKNNRPHKYLNIETDKQRKTTLKESVKQA